MTELPERLGSDSVNLAVADVLIGIVLILIFALAHEARPATLVVTTCICASAAIGRYRTSYAVRPTDERYAVAGAACLTLLALFVLVPLFEVSAWISLLVLVLWSLASSAAAIRFTLARRRAVREETDATCRQLSPRSRARVRDGWIRAVMRVVDAALAGVAIVLLSPVILACALAVFLQDRKSPIFAQQRAGLDGRPFMMYKFRTMCPDAGSEWAKPNDARITRVGAFLRRTSLDELPQLLNVLRGEMSLVGPRPEMREYANEFARTIPNYNDRHAISPGITGWAQLHCARNFQPDESPDVLPYDLFYVANYSLPLYVYCLMKTAVEVLNHRAV
ncbi:MAG TPA: sugar transferase [Verrucomicrobiae bacterium]|nr:sugar transferase [Verrucomicrobiae bacterium]